MAEAKKTTKQTSKAKEDKNGIDQENHNLTNQADTTSEAIRDTKVEKPTAKAGKRSEKALKAVEDKQAKEERKVQKTDVEEKAPAKVAPTKVRSRLDRRSKSYRKVYELLEAGKLYTLKEAVELATKTSTTKFDASVELHIRLGVDPRQADQNLRDTVVLPAGTGKTLKVTVFADGDQLTAAKKAGADVAIGDEFLQQLDKGTLDFDILITTPQNMAKLGKYARLLGPKGLMPNPKSGTVTTDLTKAVTEAKAGRVEYRVDSGGIVHVAIGKVSFGAEKLLENAQAIVQSIKANKPGSVKSSYVRSVFVTTSMGPSIAVELSEVQ